MCIPPVPTLLVTEPSDDVLRNPSEPERNPSEPERNGAVKPRIDMRPRLGAEKPSEAAADRDEDADIAAAEAC